MLNHVQSWLYVGNESRPFEILDGLPGLYRLKYASVTICGLPLYLCSYKLDGFVTWIYLCVLINTNSTLACNRWSKVGLSRAGGSVAMS